MKRFKAAIMGGSGFAGAELIRRLLLHPEVELVRVSAADHIGEPLASAHPHLEGMTDLVFEQLGAAEAARGVDVVLMGLPHEASIELVEQALDSGVRIVDMSGAFRLKDPALYARFYGAPHARPDLLARFVYGLPELNREAIRQSRFVASPGCFATTIELGLLPLARKRLLTGDVHVVAITGSSGAGVAPSPTTHHPIRAQNLRTYRPLFHQHEPEIDEALHQAGAHDLRVRFVPVSAPLTRGIFATSFAEVPGELSDAELRALFTEAYSGEPFVRVPNSRLPEVVAVSGSNYAEVGFTAAPPDGFPSGRRASRELPDGGKRLVTVFSVTDNLVKGGAGQAIQNMNLMLGLDERLSLEDVGSYP